MRRSAFVLLISVAAIPVFALPPPRDSGEQRDSWEQIDPDRNCKIIVKDGKTTLELPGNDHDLAPNRKRFNAPRRVRDVTGDFVLQARVSARLCPSDKSSVEGEDPAVWAGLVLIPADDNCIRLEYGAYRYKGEYCARPAFRVRGRRLGDIMEMDMQEPWAKEVTPEKEDHLYLSLERWGDWIYQGYSRDGEKWKYPLHLRFKGLPEKVKVGLFACSTSTAPFKAAFDQVKLLKGNRKERKPGSFMDTKFDP